MPTTALAETTIGLFKTEAVGPASPFRTGPLRTLDDVEYAKMEWVDWYNNRRHSQLDYVPPTEYETAYFARADHPGRIPPAEAEAAHYATTEAPEIRASTTN